MAWKRLGKTLLFPPVALLPPLVPVCTVGLVNSMRFREEAAPVRIAFYVLSFYTLTIWCVRVPNIIRFCKQFREENRSMQRWLSDARLRTNVSLCGNALWNGAYAALQLGLGVYHRSAWFYALALYYATLAVMRSFLVRHTLRHRPGEHLREEWHRCRSCGWVLLVLHMALTVMLLYMIRQNRSVQHHEITTIAMAAYTFASLTIAIFNVIKYRKYNSPVLSASRAVALAAACVSLLTLERTMLEAFGREMEQGTRQLFLCLSGMAISVLILVMAICLIVYSNKQMNCMENEYGK